MYRPGLTELQAVIAIARKGSFRAAALDLDMSTSALSNAIGKLEASLGVRLFNRTTRSVSLSDAGRAFVSQITPAIEDINGAIDTARTHQKIPSGTLRINTFATAARDIMSPLVLEFLRRYPQVHVDIVTEGRLVDIVAAGFDFGVRSAALVPTDMIAVSLGRPQRYAVVGSSSYFEGRDRPLNPADLVRHKCIRVRLPDGSLYRWLFEKNGEKAQIDVTGPITVDEASIARAAALEGIGLGFFMEQDVLADIRAGHLIRVLEDWTPPFPGLCLYYPGRRNSSAAHRALIALAREMAGTTRE
ncbi:LysR family transcriptional regulator [Martelella radicis]|uniref:DNA-binding transcriptional LysR family regulator n=1 Tax=Martelella radicis TaxID=1397476 RepID=A0A7W6KIR3_9HYPH|nr:LysR family transcriptional regulator [Martelella radicis]MBB4120650.1 DNA-binding transcriptional LysR family regulator [Martelella radicis]